MMSTIVADSSRHARRRVSFAFPVAAMVAGSLLSLIGHATDARAADTDAEADRAARAHFHQAEADYAAGSYAEALSEYQAGYDVQPLPGFLVNIAQCQRRLGDLERARATYGKFVLVAPDSPLLPEVRGLIEELDRLIAETERARTLPSAVQGPAANPTTGHLQRGGNDGPGGQVSAAAGGRASLVPRAIEPPPPAGTGVAAGVDLTEAPMEPSEQVPNDRATSSSHHRWWLWGSMVAVAVGAATTAALLSTQGAANTIHDGSLGSLRR